jgi:uncharacterized protein (TIGR02147 family)
MEAETTPTLKQVLQTTYFKRREKNPSYSLRAYAKQLGLQSSAVSELLRGKRHASAKLASRILDRLGVSFEEREKILKRIDPLVYSMIDLDTYHTIADWWHFGILSLVKTKGFKNDPIYISKRLGIPKLEAEKAVVRLKRLGFLKETPKGKLIRTQERFTTTDGIASSGVKKLHVDTLHLVEQSLFKNSVEERVNNEITMAIDIKKIPKARRLIDQFLDKISTCLEDGDPTEVYKLTVHLIPLTQEQTP